MADECSQGSDPSARTVPLTEPNPGLRDPPPVGEQLMASFDRDLMEKMEGNEDKHGLAIIVGGGTTGPRGPAGVSADVETMKEKFERLHLVIWEMVDRSSVEVTGVLRAVAKCKLPKTYKFIIFYFSGDGASQDNHAYVHCHVDKDAPADTLSIKKGIVAHLLTKNAPQLKDIRRIFLFDCCLKSGTPLQPQACRLEDISLPSFDNILIAYATSMTCTAGGGNAGGLWTTFLAKNMDLDCPLTTILDVTWEDVVSDFVRENKSAVRQGTMIPQGPHYTSSAGLIWLYHPDRDGEKGERFLPRWINDDVEEDEPKKPVPAHNRPLPHNAAPPPAAPPSATYVTNTMGNINIGSGVTIGAMVEPNSRVENVTVIIPAKSRKKATSKAGAEVDSSVLADYVGFLSDLKDWRRLALKLGFSFPEIREIVSENDGRKEDCILEVTNKWLQKGPSSTTPVLIKALEGVQEHGIAARLRESSVPKPSAPLTSLPDGPLNSKHLAFIIKELHELVEWQRLGLQLGLSLPTLQKIKIHNREDVELCKMEMMEAWLQGRDDVHSQGGITKKALVDALMAADLNTLAFKLDPAREKRYT